MVDEPAEYIGLPFRLSLVSEFILRSGRHVDIAGRVEYIVRDYLDRTRGDDTIWSEAHADQVTKEEESGRSFGDPNKGYQWLNLFVPNGTKIRMPYKGSYHYAMIDHEHLVYEIESLSPSEFASRVAGGTSRNAWRDLWFQFPGSNTWELADMVRKAKSGPRR
jgi:hypothetical protein